MTCNQKVYAMLDGTAQSQVAWEFFQGISRHPCGISCLLHSHYDPQQSPSHPTTQDGAILRT